LVQFAGEFALARQSWFDRAVDGANRLPRPLMALGTLGLFVSAMVDPLWFASRMQGIALVPEPLWWLLGAIVSFYFGARHQAKGQEFQIRVARSMAQVPQVVENLKALRALEHEVGLDETDPSDGAGQAKAAVASMSGARDHGASPRHPDGTRIEPGRRDPQDDNPALSAWRGSASPLDDPLGGR